MTRLHIGCGLITPDDWVNIDGSWNAWFAKYPKLRHLLVYAGILPKSLAKIKWSSHILIHDVRNGLRYSSNSIEAIYSSHLLEHLYYDEALQLLSECYRVLTPGGILRIVVPDLHKAIMDYLSMKQSDDNANIDAKSAAEILQLRLLLREPKAASGNPLYRLYSAWNDFHSHKWMYDVDLLRQCFHRTGFVEVEERKYCESRIDNIQSVERAERISNGAGICVEGVKPELL